jgi:HlyD family secretion protein
MKRRMMILMIVVLLIVGAFGAGWMYFRSNPAAWDQFLAEMAGESIGSPAPRQINRSSRRTAGLVASGSIEAEEVVVAAEMGGRIIEMAVDEGDIVSDADRLLQLDDSDLLAQREGANANVGQAEAALETAQAQLAQVMAGATSEEIAAAQAAVLAARGAVTAAEATLSQAEISAESARTLEQVESSVAMAEAALAQAHGAVAAAEANLAGAQAEKARLQAGARPQEIAMYQALLNQAEFEYRYMENLHFSFFIDPGVGGGPEERSRYQRDSVKGARDAAQARLDLALAGASNEEIATATAAVSAAAAQLQIAQAGVDAAEAALAQAQAAPETTQDQVAVAEAGVAAARAQVETMQGQQAQAEANLAGLLAGATAEEIAVLEAQVKQANAALSAAQAALKGLDIEIHRATLLAPAGGVILQRLAHQGELAVPGAPLFTLADLDVVNLTVYVPEAELGHVSLGQPVEVTVDAYDKPFVGQITHIASQAEFTPKNVQTQEERVHMVFAVKIRLDNPDHELKPGMPADALFE